MQRLFEGKKTAYSPSDLNMVSTRIRSLRNKNSISFFFNIEFYFLAEELAITLEIAKGKCFFPTEQFVVSVE